MQAFMMNKPRGCVTMRDDPRGRPTVYDHVPPWYPRLPHVGRLDANTEGLLLFTDDGRLAQAITNPGYKGLAAPGEVAPLEKVYHVKVKALLDPDDPVFAALEEPLHYHQDGAWTRPARARFLAHRTSMTWIEVVISEGRHHQVRHLCARSRLPVGKLRRVRIGPIELGDLKLRWCRPLTLDEVRALYGAAMPQDPIPPYDPIPDPPEAAG